ncbi:amidohydrolase family protein [Nioella sp.]|uniref:amidohydrolase family protein n=1 Tax=Nioella sp. TaxID=1912091 RepID=UPI003B52FF31
MLSDILRRIGLALLITVLAVTTLFVIIHAIPGDPVSIFRACRSAMGRDWLKGAIALGSRKLLTDGSFLMRTAFLTAPCSGSDALGLAYMARDTLFSEVRKLHRLGFQIHCHCSGDAAPDKFLDAVAGALTHHLRDEHRHTIIHGQVMRRDQVRRCVVPGVTISVFPAHIWNWGGLHHDETIGPDRAR